jgi:hypothetical protein
VIANLTKPLSFVKVIAYVSRESKGAQIIGGNFLSGTPLDIAHEFEHDWQKNQRVKIPVRHFSIGMAPQDGEVDRQLQAEIAKDFLVRMGFLLPAHEQSSRGDRRGDCLYLVVSHARIDPDHDSHHDHDHFHIITNIVNPFGKRIKDAWSYYRSMDSLRAIEQEFGLYQVPKNNDAIHLSHGQKQKMERELREVAQGLRQDVELPVSMRLRSIIYGATQDCPSASDFVDRLQNKGVSVVTRSLPSGKVGVSYGLESISYPGSRIRCSLNALVAQGRITYCPKNDNLIRQTSQKFAYVPRHEIQTSDTKISKTSELARS